MFLEIIFDIKSIVQKSIKKKGKNADCLSFQLDLFIINSLEECMRVILALLKSDVLCMCVWVYMLHPDMIHMIQIVWLHTKRDYFLVVCEKPLTNTFQ